MDQVELQENTNGREPKGKWGEIGTSGLQAYAGYITEAYTTKLQWPTVADEYNRMWRSDPEIGIARNVIQSFASRASLQFTLPERDEKPSDDDKKAEAFANECLEDIEGGPNAWLNSCLSRVLFYGWGWWEAPPSMRKTDWRPPGEDDWRSNYDDGLIGFRRLAFRHYKSFLSWDMAEPSGRVKGLVQLDTQGNTATIPLDRSLHIKFGDLDNPEGLATMEAMWRLERVKYGLEVVFGIGAEHTAGYLSVTAEKALDETARTAIKTAARNIMSAHEGNYAAWPQGYKGELIDVPFQGGTVVLDAIRYFGILKLALLDLQWMALGTLSPYGSNSASLDASDFFVAWFNAELSGIVKQADEQIGKRLFDYPINKAAFPGMTRRPVLGISPVQKDIKLAEMGQFLTAVSAIMPMGDDDWLAVRKKTEFLPDVLPEVETTPKSDEPDTGDEKPDDSLNSEGGPDMEEIGRNGHRDEPVPEAEMQAASNGGAMVAFFLENEFAKSLAINPGELPDGSEATLPEELHITLAFLGDVDRMGAEMRERVTAVIRDIAGKFAPLSGHIGGAGRFLKEEDGKSAFYAHPDVVGINEFRQELAKALIAAGAPVSMEHGFTPHITLAYVPKDSPVSAQLPTGEFKLDKLALSWGLEREHFPLVGERAAEFAFRPFAVGSSEQTIDVTPEAMLPTEDIDAAVRHWKKWAKDNAPGLAALIDAEAEPEID